MGGVGGHLAAVLRQQPLGGGGGQRLAGQRDAVCGQRIAAENGQANLRSFARFGTKLVGQPREQSGYRHRAYDQRRWVSLLVARVDHEQPTTSTERDLYRALERIL